MSDEAGGPGGTLPVWAVCGMKFEAQLLTERGVQAVSGLAAQTLDEAIENALAAGCAGLISIGTAGALDPALHPGAWIVPARVVTSTESYECDPHWSERIARRLGVTGGGTLAAVGAPVRDAAAKGALFRATGALAVDMESGSAARRAALHGVPFVAARVVIDPAQRALPSSALVGLRADGTVALTALIAELARHPGQLPGLFRLALDARCARQALARGVAALGVDLALRTEPCTRSSIRPRA